VRGGGVPDSNGGGVNTEPLHRRIELTRHLFGRAIRAHDRIGPARFGDGGGDLERQLGQRVDERFRGCVVDIEH
jgi:hypothetical protein